MWGFDRDRVPLLAFSPDFPTDGTLYGASMDTLYRSTDRGLSWAPVPGPCEDLSNPAAAGRGARASEAGNGAAR